MKNKHKRLLRHYWVAYAALALIPMMILAATVGIIQSNDQAEMARNLYLRSMQQTATYLDALVSDMQATVSAMSASTYLGAAKEHPTRYEGVMTSYLSNTEANSRLPVQTLYYEVGSTDLLTAHGRMSYQDFERSMDKDIDLDRSQFFTLLNGATTMRIWLLEPSQDASEETLPLAAFTFPVLSESLRKQGAFVFLVSTEDILDLISSYLGVQPDYLYIYNDSYSFTLGRYEKFPQTPAVRTAAIQSRVGAIGTMDVGGEGYDVLHYKSDLYGFHLITFIHMADLYTGNGSIRSSMLYTMVLIALVVLVGAFFVARFFYRPVRGLLDAIGEEDDGEEDEFTRIHSEVTRLQERLAMARPMMRDRLLQNLLRSRLDAAGVAQLESVCPDIQLERQQACVALVSADRNTPVDKLLLFERMDLGGADVHGVYLEEERLLALLILSMEETDRRFEQLRQIRDTLVANGVQAPRVSAGRRVQGAEKVPESFLEAYIAMNSRMQPREDERDLFLYNVAQDAQQGGNSWLMTCEDSVNIYLQALRSLNQHTALEMLHTLLQRMNESCASLLNISYARFELYSRALRLCEESVAQSFSSRGSAMEQLTDEKRFQTLMEELTRANCQAVESRRANTYQTTRQKILSAIRERCFDASFSLSELSAQVDYSATYINRCLREETGYSFIQYVSMLRIARAKELLLTTDDKIKDIVARVGYQDMASFTRKFKEYEGVTPMEYRNINRASE